MNATIRKHSDTIRNLFGQAERLTHKYRGWDHLRDAVEIASKQERQHRALGRRVFNQSVSGRATVETCAQLFALRGFVAPKKGRSFEDRLDFARGYAAAVAIERSLQPTAKADYQAFCRKARKALANLDYTDLLPRKEQP